MSKYRHINLHEYYKNLTTYNIEIMKMSRNIKYCRNYF